MQQQQQQALHHKRTRLLNSSLENISIPQQAPDLHLYPNNNDEEYLMLQQQQQQQTPSPQQDRRQIPIQHQHFEYIATSAGTSPIHHHYIPASERQHPYPPQPDYDNQLMSLLLMNQPSPSSQHQMAGSPHGSPHHSPQYNNQLFLEQQQQQQNNQMGMLNGSYYNHPQSYMYSSPPHQQQEPYQQHSHFLQSQPQYINEATYNGTAYQQQTQYMVEKSNIQQQQQRYTIDTYQMQTSSPQNIRYIQQGQMRQSSPFHQDSLPSPGKKSVVVLPPSPISPHIPIHSNLVLAPILSSPVTSLGNVQGMRVQIPLPSPVRSEIVTSTTRTRMPSSRIAAAASGVSKKVAVKPTPILAQAAAAAYINANAIAAVGLPTPKKSPASAVPTAKPVPVVEPPLDLPSILESDNGKRSWQLLKSIGKGGCGEVYLAREIIPTFASNPHTHMNLSTSNSNTLNSTSATQTMPASNQMVAVKIIKERKQFQSELNTMKTLNEHRHGRGYTPKLITAIRKRKTLVMEFLSDTIASRFERCGYHFSLKTICMLAMNMMTLVRDFNEKTGHVHVDIKPSNLCTSPNGRDIFLIDFGYSTSPLVKLPGQTGTPLFMAANLQTIGATYPSLQDDYESIGYVLMFFISGGKKGLPWGSLRTHKEIAASKCDASIHQFCSGLALMSPTISPSLPNTNTNHIPNNNNNNNQNQNNTNNTNNNNAYNNMKNNNTNGGGVATPMTATTTSAGSGSGGGSPVKIVHPVAGEYAPLAQTLAHFLYVIRDRTRPFGVREYESLYNSWEAVMQGCGYQHDKLYDWVVPSSEESSTVASSLTIIGNVNGGNAFLK